MSTQRPNPARGKTTPASTPGSFTTHAHGVPVVDLDDHTPVVAPGESVFGASISAEEFDAAAEAGSLLSHLSTLPAPATFAPSSARYARLGGQSMTVLRELDADEVDEEVGPMYRVVFESGEAADVFLDEIRPPALPEPGAAAVSQIAASQVARNDIYDNRAYASYEAFGLEKTEEKDAYGKPLYRGTFDDGRTTYTLKASTSHVAIQAGDYNVGSHIAVGSRPMSPADVAESAMDAQREVSERVGFEQAARHWLPSTRPSLEQIDAATGSITGWDPSDPVSIGGFGRTGVDVETHGGSAKARNRPALVVRLAGPETPGAPTYSIVKDRDGKIRYYRGGEDAPLEKWEEQALETEVARRLGAATVGPNRPVLRSLLRDSIAHANAADTAIGLRTPLV